MTMIIFRQLQFVIRRRWSMALGLLCIALAIAFSSTEVAHAQGQSPAPRVNVPYWDWEADDPYPSHAVFWFGQVGTESNYIDVRTIYYNEQLEIVAHIIDRNLYQSEPSPDVDLAEWDAISIWLDTAEFPGSVPSADSYRFTVQLGQWDMPEYSQQAFRGNNAGWSAAPIDFTATASWRGTDGPNSGKDAKGWMATITIPFESLGLSGPPEPASTWRFGFTLHDRDSYEQPVRSTNWPEQMNNNAPNTWGQLAFGRPDQATSDGTFSGESTIGHGLNGAIVRDAHVGGHTTCGEAIDHWTEWGNTNYGGYNQINIQNQWDVSEYPCFSKYYITFPLDSIPDDVELVSAEFVFYLFGNAGYEPGQALASAIQALTVGEDWDESTITWNNAPLAVENIALTWVDPVDFFDPGIPYTWNVTDATSDAYTNSDPLRLALYSADGERHSGKYFWSSDADAGVRPYLQVKWRRSSTTEPPIDDSPVYSVYLPVTMD